VHRCTQDACASQDDASSSNQSIKEIRQCSRRP
jgi:hypothetical protein